jgi:hypothetical protein
VSPAADGVLPVIDPRSEAHLMDAAAAGTEDVDAAVTAARRAFDEGPWPRMTAKASSGAPRGPQCARLCLLCCLPPSCRTSCEQPSKPP